MDIINKLIGTLWYECERGGGSDSVYRFNFKLTPNVIFTKQKIHVSYVRKAAFFAHTSKNTQTSKSGVESKALKKYPVS
jgi:hypothetical protein